MGKESITITPAAEEYLAEILAKNPGKAFKVSVDGKGCAGFQYNYELESVNLINPKDEIIKRDWGTVVVDNSSIMFILGSTLNLKEDLFSCELVWHNPLATSTCGCGKSFNPSEEIFEK